MVFQHECCLLRVMNCLKIVHKDDAIQCDFHFFCLVWKSWKQSGDAKSETFTRKKCIINTYTMKNAVTVSA